MIGKASIYLVIAFCGIFLTAGLYWGRIAMRSVDNDLMYYDNTIAHNIAVSGANMAANRFFLNNNWNSGIADQPFAMGRMSVRIESLPNLQKRIISVGTYNGKSETVMVLLQPSSFAKFAYYVNDFPANGFFYTGDTITGPFHSESKLIVKGSPVFNSKATSKNSLQMLKNNPPTSPVFMGGYQSGVSVPMNWQNTSIKAIAQSDGKYFSAPGGESIDVKMIFNGNATVTWRKRIASGPWSIDSTQMLKVFAPNGLIYVNEGNVYIEGTVSGAYTIFADHEHKNGTGNIFIENDIVYKDDPEKYPGSADMLGLVCTNSVFIVDNAVNRNNVNINASIFAYNGGLGLTNEKMPASGTLKVYGGLVEYRAQITGKIDGSGALCNGYNEKIVFDERLMNTSSPYFPTTGKYEIVSWLE